MTGGELRFGMYPGGTSGDDQGELTTGPPDDPAEVNRALDELQGTPGRPFLVRAYVRFDDTTAAGGPHPVATPADATRYARHGRTLDLVAQYQSAAGNVAGYRTFLRELVEQYGAITSTLQVTEEPNVTGNPTLDGYYPAVAEAIITGVPAARQRARELGHEHLRVGVNTTPLFGPAAGFLTDLARLGGEEFTGALDYLGLDFFPDVFRPVAADQLGGAVSWLLGNHRDSVLSPAGLGHLPLHVTEHGWPTGPDRTPDRQAEVVDTVVRALAEQARRLHITGYSHFSLRDADSANPGLFHQFGLTTDDYTRKPAFHRYRALIEEFSPQT